MASTRFTFRFLRVAWLLSVAVQWNVLVFLQQPAGAEEQLAGEFYLRDGDRVVFYGDSITEQGFYTLPIETFMATCCADIDVSFLNSGWSGDRAWGGEGGMLEERLRRDVIAHRPKVVTVMLGMNDGYYMAHDPKAVAAFEASLEKLIDILQRELPDVRITILGSSPYDNVTPGTSPAWERDITGGYNSVVVRFCRAAQQVAQRRGLLFVDMNEPLVRLLEELQATDPELARQLIPDRIHPGSVAGMVMAARLLAAWHAPGRETVIHIDAAPNKEGIRHEVANLPSPFSIKRNDALADLVPKLSPDIKKCGDDTVRVANLPFPRGELLIDDRSFGTYTSRQFASGVELSALRSPRTLQFEQVEKLIELRNRFRFLRWRYFEIPSKGGALEEDERVEKDLARIEQELAELLLSATRSTASVIRVVPSAQ